VIQPVDVNYIHVVKQKWQCWAVP